MKTIDLLKTFSEPQRLRILNLLHNSELTVTEMVDILDLSQSNVSHHLKLLKNQNLVDFYKKGSQSYYKLIKNPSLPPNIQGIWSQIKTIIKETDESSEDERKLLNVLSKRKSSDLSQAINSWRKQQPDLIFTADLAMGGINCSGSALDIGCGNGEFLEIIENSFDNIYGIDISVSQLNEARQRSFKNPKIFLVQANALSLPFQPDFFNTIYLRLVLGFLDNPGECLIETSQILKRSGRISIIDKIDREGLNGENFFTDLCKKHKTLKVVKFQIFSNIFLCVLEKIS